MNKKIIAIVLSLMLALGLMIPSFAVENGDIAVSDENLSLEDVSDFEEETTAETTTAEETTTEKAPTTVAPETTTAAAEGGFEFDINDILSSDIMQDLMQNENVIDLTNILIDLVVKYNPDAIAQMGQETAQKMIQSMFDTIVGSINQIAGNAGLIIKYDPIKVLSNLFDLDTDSLTTKNPEDGTKDPNELEFSIGDVDGDGKVSAADARMILRRAAKLIVFSNAQNANADVDKDGKVTANDARIVLRVSAGLESFDA